MPTYPPRAAGNVKIPISARWANRRHHRLYPIRRRRECTSCTTMPRRLRRSHRRRWQWSEGVVTRRSIRFTLPIFQYTHSGCEPLRKSIPGARQNHDAAARDRIDPNRVTDRRIALALRAVRRTKETSGARPRACHSQRSSCRPPVGQDPETAELHQSRRGRRGEPRAMVVL